MRNSQARSLSGERLAGQEALVILTDVVVDFREDIAVPGVPTIAMRS